MALAAVGPPGRVQDVFFYEPIILAEKTSREVQLTLHPLDDGLQTEAGASGYIAAHMVSVMLIGR